MAQVKQPSATWRALLDQATMRVADFANPNIRVVRRDEAEAIIRDALASVPSETRRRTCVQDGHVWVGTGDERVVCDDCGVEREQTTPSHVASKREWEGYCSAEVEETVKEIDRIYGDGKMTDTSRDWGQMCAIASMVVRVRAAVKAEYAPSTTPLSEAERLSKKWLAAHPHAMMVVEHAGAMLRDALQPTASAASATPFKQQDADMLAAAVDRAIYRNALDPRSEIADCRLDYGKPFTSEEVEAHLARRRHGKNRADGTGEANG